MENQLSSRQMAKLLKKLPIHEGDIVLVKKSKFDENEVMDALKRGVEKLDLGSILVILADDFEDITTLNRQEMQSHGWYHVSDINKITGRINWNANTHTTDNQT